MTTARRVVARQSRATTIEPAEKPVARVEIDRTADRVEAVNRLVEAAMGLASTIAVTERLAQERADVLTSRATLLGPSRDAAGQAPIISLADAARRSGRHPEVLRRWCVEGRIPAVRVGRTWGITPETLALLMAHAARSRPRLPTPDPA